MTSWRAWLRLHLHACLLLTRICLVSKLVKISLLMDPLYRNKSITIFSKQTLPGINFFARSRKLWECSTLLIVGWAQSILKNKRMSPVDVWIMQIKLISIHSVKVVSDSRWIMWWLWMAMVILRFTLESCRTSRSYVYCEMLSLQSTLQTVEYHNYLKKWKISAEWYFQNSMKIVHPSWFILFRNTT